MNEALEVADELESTLDMFRHAFVWTATDHPAAATFNTTIDDRLRELQRNILHIRHEMTQVIADLRVFGLADTTPCPLCEQGIKHTHEEERSH
jgi:hypothetical protein